MECLLCKMWARMPYAKKWSTPTSPQETEGALIVGYWLATRSNTVPKLCERHMAVIEMLDTQEEQQAIERTTTTVPTVVHTPPSQKRVKQAQPIQPTLPIMPPIIAIGTITPQPIKPVQSTSDFQLGLTPLRNENTITDPPPLPMAMDLSAPYQNRAQPGTIEGALEAARMPPTEGAKVNYPCPSCGKEITTGDVHSCEVVDEA